MTISKAPWRSPPIRAATAGRRRRENPTTARARGRLGRASPLLPRAARRPDRGGEPVPRVAFRTGVRAPLDMAAMMADQRAAKTMLDEPGVALGAAEAMAAMAAQRQRRIAAPIEKQQRLFAARDRLADRQRKPRRDPSAARRAFLAHVDRFERRHGPRARARIESQITVAPAHGVDARFDRGRRRGENDRGLLHPRAHDRHVARVIADAVVLLVGAFMLLIDDDQPQIAKGQEQRRARADDHVGLRPSRSRARCARVCAPRRRNATRRAFRRNGRRNAQEIES